MPIPLVTPADRRRMRRELRLTAAQALTVTDTGGSFAPFMVRYWGVTDTPPRGSPWWAYGEDGRRMQVRVVQLFLEGNPAYLERAWYPTRGTGPLLIVCPGDRVTQRQIAAIWRARDNLPAAPPGPPSHRATGAKSKNKYPIRELYVLAIHQHIYAYWDRYNAKHNAQETLGNATQWARWLDLNYKTFQKRNAEYEITIDDIRGRRVK